MRCLYLFSLLIFISCQSITKQVDAHRMEYMRDFINDPRSPLKEDDLDDLDFFPPSKDAVVKATFTLTPTEEPFELPTYSGITRTYRQWGIAHFDWNGKPHTLRLYENMMNRSNPMYADYLFLPFKDETNGISTYGGGRYMNMSKKEAEDGVLTIDFNTCYNPWCAYSDGFNCPIPPAANHLPFEVQAGEKMFKGDIKHKAAD
jgi:uncharacterized protein (DUF1684 family)